jgi:hypothetical protein
MRKSFDICGVTLLFVQAISTTGPAARGEGKGAILEKLRGLDKQALTAFTLTVRVEEPAHGWSQAQGWATKRYTFTRTQDQFAMTYDLEKLPPLRYWEPGQEGYHEHHFDKEGNLVLWIHTRKFAFADVEVNDEWEQRVLYRLTPGNEVSPGPVDSSVWRFTAGNTDGLALANMQRFLWALGRGYSASIGSDPESVEADEQGMLLTVRGSKGRGDGEIWSLELDLQNAYLVRTATIRNRTDGRLTREVKSKGTRWFGPVALAEEGSVTMPLGASHQLQWKVTLLDYSPESDGALIEEARGSIATALERKTNIIDRRIQGPREPNGE